MRFLLLLFRQRHSEHTTVDATLDLIHLSIIRQSETPQELATAPLNVMQLLILLFLLFAPLHLSAESCPLQLQPSPLSLIPEGQLWIHDPQGSLSSQFFPLQIKADTLVTWPQKRRTHRKDPIRPAKMDRTHRFFGHQKCLEWGDMIVNLKVITNAEELKNFFWMIWSSNSKWMERAYL